MSNLSELLPAGGGGKNVNFVASGTLGNGVTVALKTDGTVEAVSSTGNPASAGTPVIFETGQIKSDSYPGSAFDTSAGKIVIAYCDDDNSDAGTAVVGTIDPSDNSISFGTPVVFRATSTSGFDTMGVAYDANAGKVVITYRDSYDTGNGFAIVGTVSGTSISFGSQVQFNSSSPAFRSRVVYDSDSQKVVVVYRGGNQGRARVGTVSGTSISFGTEATFNAASTYWISPAYDTNAQRVVIAYQDSGNSNYGAAIVGTVSGTSISFGSEVVFESATVTNCSAVYDSNSQKIVIAYQDQGNSSYGTGIVGTVSGTSISFGSAATFESAYTSSISIAYSTTAQKVGIAYQDGGNSNYGTVVTGSVSGTSITFDSPDVFESAATTLTTTVYDSTNNRFAIAYRDEGNSNQGTSAVYQTVGSNVADFIGITDAAISDTASGSVTIKGGISTNVTGLTAGTDYYVQDDGSLSGAGGIPYDIVSASLATSFSISAQQTLPTGLAFSADGTKMFTCGELNSDVDEYTLSTAYDVSTASYSQNFSIAGQETEPTGIAFNTDGTKMFVLGNAGNDVNEYALSTGFDVSTASFSQAFSISAQEATPHGIAFNTDGTKMFIVGRSGVDVNEYALSTGFDVSTASYSQNFSVSSQEADPLGIAFNSDGTKMFITGDSNDAVFQYNLSTGFDVSTASYASITFSVSAQDTNPNDIAFSSDGTKMFIIGASGDSVYQYSTTPASTTVLAGTALSSTSINLDYTT